MTKDEAKVIAETINLLSKGKHDGVFPKDMIHMNKLLEATTKILSKYSSEQSMKQIEDKTAPLKSIGKSGKKK